MTMRERRAAAAAQGDMIGAGGGFRLIQDTATDGERIARERREAAERAAFAETNQLTMFAGLCEAAAGD